MAFYETVFIARQDMTDAAVKSLTDDVTNYITSTSGKILKIENWGLRTLAYLINKNKKGHYVLVEFDADTAIIAEMERQLRLNEDVLRYMTVRLEQPSKEASAVLKPASEREEGGYRGRSERSGSDTGYRPRRPQPTDQEAA